MAEIDPITLAVLAGRMEQIADEMDATLFRAAFNPIIAEAHDASHGLYHAATGDTLVQGKSGLPIFFDPVWFGIIVVVVTEISLITPPVGLNVFVLKGVVGDVSTGTIFRGVTPFWMVDILRLILLLAFPALVLFLRRLAAGRARAGAASCGPLRGRRARACQLRPKMSRVKTLSPTSDRSSEARLATITSLCRLKLSRSRITAQLRKVSWS
ncbi:TRAP transporter large permease subunit [Sulfitobacter alexandrii]|uniref:TRAP transporter large permease subunit n=1 Tax=Sulfitobacter alexandrii TaxID=1917485 RepID=UPI002684A79C